MRNPLRYQDMSKMSFQEKRELADRYGRKAKIFAYISLAFASLSIRLLVIDYLV